ncbi:MAG TPA: cbb3-type cytochrome oxidase assembly protein CcoS [Steroidobacteraceae bacterium]|nr:cbb3-type cytochrome oxidase assembly protein CcoS [Steroidobacteraceae bacterium]
MSILFVLVPLSLCLVVFAGWAFFWAVDKGQFDDLETPAWNILHDDEPPAEQDDAARGTA